MPRLASLRVWYYSLQIVGGGFRRGDICPVVADEDWSLKGEAMCYEREKASKFLVTAGGHNIRFGRSHSLSFFPCEQLAAC